MRRLEAFEKTQTPVAFDDAYSALASDLITFICYGKDWNFLDDSHFKGEVRQAGGEIAHYIHINRFFPWMFATLRALSPQILSILIPGKAAMFKFQESLLNHAMEIAENGSEKEAPSTIISKLVDSSVPVEERGRRRLEDEVLIILAAGTETSSHVLTKATYFLGSEKTIANKLWAELRTIMPTRNSTATYSELERLPYLVRLLFV